MTHHARWLFRRTPRAAALALGLGLIPVFAGQAQSDPAPSPGAAQLLDRLEARLRGALVPGQYTLSVTGTSSAHDEKRETFETLCMNAQEIGDFVAQIVQPLRDEAATMACAAQDGSDDTEGSFSLAFGCKGRNGDAGKFGYVASGTASAGHLDLKTTMGRTDATGELGSHMHFAFARTGDTCTNEGEN